MTTYVLTITGEVTRQQGGHTGDLIAVLTDRLHGRFVSVEGPAAYVFSVDDQEREKTLRDVLHGEWGSRQAVLTWLTVSRQERQQEVPEP